MLTTVARASVLDAFHFRHATKAFEPGRSIPDQDFQTILEAARLSPTSFGLEAWRLVVIQDQAVRAQLLPGFWGGQTQIPTASHLVVLTVLRGEQLDPRSENLPRYLRDVRKQAPDRIEGTVARLKGFFDQDFHLETPEKKTEWAARQSYIVLGNMMTVAAALGIDSCPMEGFDLDSLEERLHGHGGFDRSTHAVACLVAFGYRMPGAQVRELRRRPLDQTLVGWA